MDLKNQDLHHHIREDMLFQGEYLDPITVEIKTIAYYPNYQLYHLHLDPLNLWAHKGQILNINY